VEFSLNLGLFFRYLAGIRNFTLDNKNRQKMQQLIGKVAKFLAYKEKNRLIPQVYLEEDLNNPFFI
jgi:hypothetical protein